MARKCNTQSNKEMQEQYNRLYRHYKNIALNLYKWENLPNGIESRFIERQLYENGQAFLVDDDTLGFLCLKCSNSGMLNVYGEPTQVVLTGNGFSKQYPTSVGVRILNNDTAIPTRLHIEHYASRMAELDSIMQQNLRQQRVPHLFATTKENEFSIKNLYNKMYNGEPAIFVDKDMLQGDSENISVLATQAPYLISDLQQHRYELERELLTFLGINTTIEKKERLLVDETNANNGYIEMSLDLGLKSRELACEQINKKFGLNVKVSATMHELTPHMETEGESDGEL